MRYLNIALSQINPTLGDFKQNLSRILDFIRRVGERAHLVVFPELALPGYPAHDLLLRRDFLYEVKTALSDLQDATKDFDSVILLGLPFYKEDGLYNSVVSLHKGKIIGICHKRYLSRWGAFGEERYFRMGDGLLFLDVNGISCGVTFWEDLWMPSAINNKYKTLIAIGVLPYEIGGYNARENLLKARALETQAYVVYVNMVGGQDDLVFDGRSLVISPQGKIIARAKAFEEDLLIVSLPMEPLESLRLLEPRLREESRVEDIETITIHLRGEPPYFEGRIEANLEGEAEIYSALKLSLSDYVRKNGFKGVILGLSGGIDSALVATLAVDTLGRERVKALFMPSEFTSRESYEDAKRLSENLGIELLELPILQIFKCYRDELAQRLHCWDFTVADENLQARIRANLLFYLSNREGYLVLSTSNKSESATGYGTIYGDIAGGFAPLKDVYKTWVYRLARYRNSLSPVIPERILLKAPSAELRPGQTDQETLPPYDLLDEILQLHLEEGMTPREIIERGFEAETVYKVMKMVKSAEYKRRQAPVGPKITKRAFGTDIYLPLTCGFL